MNRIVTATKDQREILSAILALHVKADRFDADVTYSKGAFWRGLCEPRLKFDKAPERPGVIAALAEQLPLPDKSLASIVFDPPFVFKNPARHNGKLGIIESRFSGYGSAREMWQFYRAALCELYRVLAPRGVLVVKCQDTVSGGKQYLSHVEIICAAQELGFYVKDLFVLCRDHVLWSPNMARQQHARKNHSYFLVLEKTRGGTNGARGQKSTFQEALCHCTPSATYAITSPRARRF